ncbi:MAG: TetR/AcrR family transcriptional regulator [Campylobacteraceae bacterium]|jgi:TetR/AcrR family transcriptional repressor of cmeABC operon|nr:TetR/AcrR family transcriptional regulator [Campylobacteraceae bacterium]
MKKHKFYPDAKCENTEEALSERGKIRYKKLLCAATEVFLEKGFRKTNMNEIVKRGGGSLATAYKFFGSKEELFFEILSQNAENLFEDIKRSNISYEGKFETFLYDIGKRFTTMLHDERTYVFHRLIVHEGHKNNAHLGKIFFESAWKRTSQILTEYFEREKAKGNIDVEDTTLAAYQFFQVVKEPYFFAKVLGLDVDDPVFDPDKALRQTVKIFSKGMLKS